MKVFYSFLNYAILLLFTSCATILTGTKQTITFKCEQDGRVFQNLTEIGRTNTEIRIKRRDIIKLYTIKTEGCPDKQIELPITINPVFYVNLPFVFLFGVGISLCYVDAAEGSMYKTEKVIYIPTDCKTKK